MLDFQLREGLMCGVQEFTHIRRFAAIPAEILIPGNDIADHADGIFGRDVAGRCRQSGRIFLVGQFVQFTNIFGRIIAMRLQFVEQTPETDGRMIEVLPDEFFQLFTAIGTEAFLIHKTTVQIAAGTYKGDFGPSDKAVTVHQVIHIGSLRIMGQTDGVDSHFGHQCGIFFMMHLTKSVSHFISFLMAAYTLKLQMFAVQEEAFLGIHPIEPQSQRLADAVGHHSVFRQRHFGPIQERILTAVPQAGILELNIHELSTLARHNGYFALLLPYDPVFLPDFHIYL